MGSKAPVYAPNRPLTRLGTPNPNYDPNATKPKLHIPLPPKKSEGKS